MNAKQIWQTTLERLQTKVSTAVFITWFQGTTGISYQEGIFVAQVPTGFVKAHLEGRFRELIRSVLTEVIDSPIEVQFVVAKGADEQHDPPPKGGNERTRQRPYRLPKGRLPTTLGRKRPGSRNPYTETYQDIQEESRTPLIYQQEWEEKTFHDDNSEGERPSAQPFPITQMPRKQEYNPTLPTDGLLNPRYTFNTFIVGKSNKLAHATCMAVADNPGHVYNPLFLYGGVGLGKTHLLHAIGHAGEDKGLRVLYTTSEKFTNEIINAIRFQKTEEFRAKYRQIDILLVDDIQFIAGKESTEEEFFHTFNSLHNDNKQIVVTSDRPPKAISSLQDRLRSRFEWGLLADVQAPEYEHRLAILRSKCESLRFTVPQGVIEYIARPECDSVRELEGGLNRVVAYATLHDRPLTVSLAAEALQHIYDKKQPSTELTVAQVLDGICHYYNVSPDILKGKQRDRDIVWPRQVAMYLMREETSASLLQIGNALGGRDHTTIMHGWEKVHAEMGNNEQARLEVAAVLEALTNRPL